MAEDLATNAASEAQPRTAAGVTPAGPPGYELLDEVGRGGMGVVYRARDQALGRDVAVKLLSERYAPDSLPAQRFLSEARITGQLQHPGIPAVHQVGHLPDGRPFLAMKLIKGSTLEAVLKDRPDPSAERGRLLAVFEAVCQAVGYAHAHRVIHRDLKPSNVMVGAFGEVQVMDWGLAKVLGEELTAPAADRSAPEATRAWTQVSPTPEAGSHTQAGSLVGTPAFIPPEQAAGELAKVDERADVFGLGALLAVILTGKPPYVGENLESVRVLAVRGKVDDCLARLAGCGAEPELVSLCRQCLAFEPGDRPRDAGEVAQAVARLRSAAEERARTAEREKAAADARSEEQWRKRQWQFAAAGVVVVALVGGMMGLGAYLRAQAQANADLEAKNSDLAAANEREKQAKETAETRETEIRAVLEFVENKVFAAARPEGQEGGLGHDVPLHKAIDSAVQFVDKSFTDQPLIEARLRLTLGRSFLALGEYRKAAEQYDAARAIYLPRLGPDHPDTLRSLDGLALSYLYLGQYADALKLCEETLPRLKTALGPDHVDTLRSMRNSAWSYDALGRFADAVKVHDEALPLHKAKLGPDHRDTLTCMSNLGVTYSNLGRHADALKLRQETLARQQATLGPDHPDTLMSMLNLANTYSNLGRDAEALKLVAETLAIQKVKLPPDHPNTLTSMMAVAICTAATGRYADALKLFEETLARQQAKYGPDHPGTAWTTNFLAWTLAIASDAKFRDPPRAVELAEKAVKAQPNNPDFRGTLGTARYRTRDWKGAIADLEKAVGIRGPNNPNGSQDGFFLAMAHWQLGEKDKARQWFDKSVQWMDKTTPENSELRRFRAEAAELLGVEKKD